MTASGLGGSRGSFFDENTLHMETSEFHVCPYLSEEGFFEASETMNNEKSRNIGKFFSWVFISHTTVKEKEKYQLILKIMIFKRGKSKGTSKWNCFSHFTKSGEKLIPVDYESYMYASMKQPQRKLYKTIHSKPYK